MDRPQVTPSVYAHATLETAFDVGPSWCVELISHEARIDDVHSVMLADRIHNGLRM